MLQVARQRASPPDVRARSCGAGAAVLENLRLRPFESTPRMTQQLHTQHTAPPRRRSRRRWTYQQAAVETLAPPQGAHDAAAHLLGVPHRVQHPDAASCRLLLLLLLRAAEQTWEGGFTPPSAPPSSFSLQTRKGRLRRSSRRRCCHFRSSLLQSEEDGNNRLRG